MPLTVSLGRLKGVVEVVNTESPGYNALVFGIAAPPTVKTERYTIDAVLTGSVAEFELRQEDVGDGAGFIGVKSILGGLGTSKKSGFIVFEPNGKSATYLDTSNDKLGKSEVLTRVR